MEPCTASKGRVRLLGLGNEMLGDDAFGILVARELQRRCCGAEIVCSSASGFHLLDDVLGAERLLVVDTIPTGRAKPGTLHIFGEADLHPPAGRMPHTIGLFDVLAAGRALSLPVPRQVTVIGVEPADCSTVGGAMHPDVRDAMSKAVELAAAFLDREGSPWVTQTRLG